MPEFGCTNRITLADDEFLVVYGANHVASGEATCASVNVYASEEAKPSSFVIHSSIWFPALRRAWCGGLGVRAGAR